MESNQASNKIHGDDHAQVESRDKAIYELITKSYGNKIPFSVPSLYRNKFEKWLLIGATISLLIAFVSLFFNLVPISYFFLFVVIIFLLAYEVSISIPMMKEIFRPPTHAFMVSLSERVLEDEIFINKLSNFPLDGLERVCNRLRFEVGSVHRRIGLFIGVVGRFGIFPAVAAIYGAYAKVLSEALPYNLDVLLMAFIVGIYLGSVALSLVTTRLESMIYFLESAMEEVSSKEAKTR